METRYFIEFTVRNKESGSWLHKTSDEGSSDDINEAKRIWAREIDRLYGSADFDFVSVVLVDIYGNSLKVDTKDERPTVPEE